jgi:hypothetical protein
LIPNKKKVTQQRGRAISKTDRMISQVKYEIRQEKKERDGTEETPGKKEDAKELKPAAPAPLPKKQAAKTLDAGATAELLTQLRQKLKIPQDRELTWSYLEYGCVYHGIRLNDIQKKALKQTLVRQAEQGATPQ